MTREAAVRRMLFDYARRTGLTDTDRPPVRYLWTDAFAVCNFLGLHEEFGDDEALELAIRLVDQTHHVLGRHRSDDSRRGWISGLSEREGEAHPTAGGLRIGKRLPERGAHEPANQVEEWDRDGQYFHYLTRWMHALVRVARVTKDPTHLRHAVELARAAYAGFTHASAGGSERLCWKMSIDLSRTLVIASGQHDPLDGLVVYHRIQAGVGSGSAFDLRPEIEGLAKMCAGRSWDTDDALGVGGLLCDAYWLVELAQRGVDLDSGLLDGLLQSSLFGLEALAARHGFDEIAERRLAFRELGLSIGLRAVARIVASTPKRRDHSRVGGLLAELQRHLPRAAQIESFWLDPSHRAARSWTEHRDINEMMLATSLAPAGYLGPDSELRHHE